MLSKKPMLTKKKNFVTVAGVLAAVMTSMAPFALGNDPMSGDAEKVRAARAISSELASKLKGQLEAAMKDGGPVKALSVCNTVAPEIATALSETFGGEVGRTGLKVRNLRNAPDDFERKTLERFIAEAKAGADVTKLEHFETVDHNGKRMFRYMKAIPMSEKPCAACHGKAIDPAVLSKIREIYPEDQATGFTPGEIRGAFTIAKETQ